jgi:hypothetical protein
MDLLTQQAQASGKDLVDYAFQKALILGMILITLGCAIILTSAVAYWILKKRFAGAAGRET